MRTRECYVPGAAAGAEVREEHICFDVLDRFLAGEPIGRIVAGDAMKCSGWQRLTAEHAAQFGIEAAQ